MDINLPNILSILTFLPLFGAVWLMIPWIQEKQARSIALFVTGFTFLLSLTLLGRFDPEVGGFQLVESGTWFNFAGLELGYKMGIDGISLWFVLLSTFLMPICVLASGAIKHRVREYMIAFLLLETMMIGMFCALDMVLFYVFFEGTLIPMFLIIGIWGGDNRVYAAFKFFLYTLLGSLLMLVALVAVYLAAGGNADIASLLQNPPAIAHGVQIWLFLAFFAAFAVKIPMWPVHTWLPDAHVQAPTAGSVILAGVLLKMGGYGFLRFSLPMLPNATETMAPFVFALSVIAIIYTSLVALAQTDMKKLIAYSSVAHMGFVTLGLFTLNAQGVQGAIFQMLSHGVISAALFLCVGVVYDRMHTREIDQYGGVVNVMPRFALVFMVFMLGSVGLPGTAGFVGEFTTLLGAFQVNTTAALLATTGVVLGAAYMLLLYRNVVFGKIANDAVAKLSDLTRREIAIFVPLVFLTIFMGVYPEYFLQYIDASVTDLLSGIETALAEGESGTELAATPAADH
ncbi:MAG: NADH-quinone oxidoreductase subunit M [Alphaproteobacteria bacterium]